MRSGTETSHSLDAQRGLHALYSRTNAPVYQPMALLYCGLAPWSGCLLEPAPTVCALSFSFVCSNKQLLSTLSVSVAGRPEGRAGVHDQRSCTQPLN